MKNKAGDTVIFTDEFRRDHNALVTDVFSESCINVLFVSADPSKNDSYGRQIERRTSVGRYSEAFKFGNCFREVGVEAKFEEPARPVA